MTLSFITKSIKGVLTMKKTVITIISIILGIALVFLLAMLIRNYIVPVLTIANSQKKRSRNVFMFIGVTGRQI